MITRFSYFSRVRGLYGKFQRKLQTLLENIIFSIVSKTVYMGYFCAKRRKLKRLLAGETKFLKLLALFMLFNKAINDTGPKEC